MAQAFSGKTVFITGASSGIGAACAREFARQGAKVALAARRIDKLEGVCAEIRASGGEAFPVECDVRDRASIDEAVRQVIDRFGAIDVVLANAGFGVNGLATKLETSDFRRQFDTNFFGALDTVYATLPHLLASKGRIALVSSVMGHMPVPTFAPYCSSKFAVHALAECLYYDLADTGVSVTCISPGIVESELRSVNIKGEYTGKPDPAPKWITMPAATAARHMVRAIDKRKPLYVVTFHGKLMVFAAQRTPGLYRFLLRTFSRGRLGDIQRARQGEDALH
jgi:NADP-dependent 3-hydroxy acid dehydrogenase YdfG